MIMMLGVDVILERDVASNILVSRRAKSTQNMFMIFLISDKDGPNLSSTSRNHQGLKHNDHPPKNSKSSMIIRTYENNIRTELAAITRFD